MNNEIQNNLVYLTENFTNLQQVLLYFEEHNILSRDECEEISNGRTTLERNHKLLIAIEKKDWDLVRNTFLEVLRKTNNGHCANIIERNFCRLDKRYPILHPKISKWWPDKVSLIKSLHKRKCGSQLLVEELQARILKDENRTVVIFETQNAAKYSGMGGVGKTLTAKWYAHHYEQDYDHILWIDSGEGSLLQSLQKLAWELKVVDRNELTSVEELARLSFKTLSEFKCLWIFDNAESYTGKGGIQKILPKYQKTFFCVITSRWQLWGTKNVGFGKISDLQLDIFSQEESLEFLKTTLCEEIEYTDHQLKELCRLVDNLPLALQLAVAALNDRKIDLKNYIEKTSVDDLENVVAARFDDYEKKINKNIKLSQELILKEKNGKLASKVLVIFGYIRPDNVELIFISKILKCKLDSVEMAVDLLEKYSLVSKANRLVNIHRLLQQVIRHNGKDTETSILRKIFSCPGFLDYKFIPFTKYANEKLQKQFPNIKTELLDQGKFKELIKEGKWEEAAQKAKYIHEELNTRTTKFNYAISLIKNGQVEECAKTLQEMFAAEDCRTGIESTKTMKKALDYLNSNGLKTKAEEDRKVWDLEIEPTKMEIGNFLFDVYLALGKNQEAIAVGNQLRHSNHIVSRILAEILSKKRLKEATQLSKLIAEEFGTTRTTFNYAICLYMNGQLEECVHTTKQIFSFRNAGVEHKFATALEVLFKYIKINGLKMKIMGKQVWECLNLNWEDVPTEKEIGDLLFYAYLRLGNIKESLRIGKHIIRNLNKMIQLLSIAQIPNYHLIAGNNKVELILGVTANKIEFSGCHLEITSFDVLSLDDLMLKDVSFTKFGNEYQEVMINSFLNLRKINRLTLINEKKEQNMCIDMGEDVALEMDHLHLEQVRVVNWKKNPGWYIQNLILKGIVLEKTKEENWLSSLDISCIPRAKKLSLSDFRLNFRRSQFQYKLSSEELLLEKMTFIFNGQEMSQVTVNKILDLAQINRLTLDGDIFDKNMSIDLSGQVFMEFLKLWNVRVLNWKNSNWNVQKLCLNIPILEETGMTIQELLIYQPRSLDLSCLPKTIQKLTLWETKVVIRSGQIYLPNLKHLTLHLIPKCSILIHFLQVQLHSVHFAFVKEIDMHLLPQSVKLVKVTKHDKGTLINFDYFDARRRVTKLDKFVLERFSAVEEQIIYKNNYLETDSVVIYNDAIKAKDLMQLMKERTKFTVGKVDWTRENFNNFSQHVDRQSEFYFCESGRGWAIGEAEFQKCRKLL